FSYSYGIALAVLFLGVVYRVYSRGGSPMAPAFLLGLTAFAHGYAVLWAGLSAAFFLYASRRPRATLLWLLAVGALAFAFAGVALLPPRGGGGWARPVPRSRAAGAPAGPPPAALAAAVRGGRARGRGNGRAAAAERGGRPPAPLPAPRHRRGRGARGRRPGARRDRHPLRPLRAARGVAPGRGRRRSRAPAAGRGRLGGPRPRGRRDPRERRAVAGAPVVDRLELHRARGQGAVARVPQADRRPPRRHRRPAGRGRVQHGPRAGRLDPDVRGAASVLRPLDPRRRLQPGEPLHALCLLPRVRAGGDVAEPVQEPRLFALRHGRRARPPAALQRPRRGRAQHAARLRAPVAHGRHAGGRDPALRGVPAARPGARLRRAPRLRARPRVGEGWAGQALRLVPAKAAPPGLPRLPRRPRVRGRGEGGGAAPAARPARAGDGGERRDGARRDRD